MDPVNGLPPGAVVTPINGLPPGAVATPISSPAAPATGAAVNQPQQATTSSNAADTMVTPNPEGLIKPGNLKIWNRPRVQNDDGSYSSEYSTSFADEQGHEVLVPTVVNGRFLTADGKKPAEGSDAEKAMFKEAWKHYQQTGENLGTFDNPDHADFYASILHSRGQGLYTMKSPQGQAKSIPYGAVHEAMQRGYLFTDKPTLQKYARDLSADPLHEDRVNQFLDNHPWIGAPISAFLGLGQGALKTAVGADKLPTTKGETEAQVAAAEPLHGVAQHLGDAAENVAEFFTGDELAAMGGKILQGAPMVQKLKAMTSLADVLGKYPTLAKLAKIGSTVVKQGTSQGGIQAAQTYMKTGDPQAALIQGGETAATAGLIQGAGATAEAVKTARAGVPEAAPVMQKIGGVDVPVAPEVANATATATAAKSAEAYTATARASIQDTLDKLNVHPDLSRKVLDSTQDFTSAKDQMQRQVLNPIYDNLNNLTGGRFRNLNAQLQSAKLAARSGSPDAVANYRNKLAEMNNFLDQETGGLPKDYLDRVKSAWRQWNVLDDISGRLDRNLSGVPGASQASKVQRGVNGKGLMNSLSSAVRTYGRPTIEEALGKDRLENLEEIARLNLTDKDRKAFNVGIEEVAQRVPKEEWSRWGKRTAAMTAGAAVSHLAGGNLYVGSISGEALYEASRYVLRAVQANPQIGKNFMFALESGASAEKYGPYIAGLIKKMNTDMSAEDDQTGNEDKQQ